MRVFFDIETQSGCSLKDCGGRVYATHPTTRLMSLVACIGDKFHCWVPPLWPRTPQFDPVTFWPDTRGEYTGQIVVHYGSETPAPIVEAVAQNAEFVAHNLNGFDKFVWEALINPVPTRWYDTMPHAMAAGLPGSLDKIGERLVGSGKDTGRVIASKYFDVASGPPKPGHYSAIMRYNVDDVWVLRMLANHLNEYPYDAKRVEVNNRINERGCRVDEELAKRLIDLSNQNVLRAGEEISRLTNGRLHGQNLRTKEVVKWLNEQSVTLPNMRRETVERFIESPDEFIDAADEANVELSVKPETLDVLRLRNAALRNTSAKMANLLKRVDGGRVRDMFVPFGAGPGRFTSRGLQVHNLPRTRKGVKLEQVLESDMSYDTIAKFAAEWGVLIDDILSSLIRPVFIADPGHELVIGDFSAVECRGLAWMAGEEKLINQYKEGVDVYKYMASRIFGVEVEAVTADQRQVGKNVILGCGYGMSWRRFGIYMANQGISLEDAGTDAESCITTYRKTYPNICSRDGIWAALSHVLFDVVGGRTTRDTARCEFSMQGGSFVCTLPSGRRIIYRNARIEDRVPGYCALLGLPEFKRPTVIYDGMHGEAVLHGPKMTENIVQAHCNDLLCNSMFVVDEKGCPILLHVHDEIVTQQKLGTDYGVSVLTAAMSTVPEFSAGIPLDCKVATSVRYTK